MSPVDKIQAESAVYNTSQIFQGTTKQRQHSEMQA